MLESWVGCCQFVLENGVIPGFLCFRGFFKGDKVLGTVTVKLQPLESVCVLHDSYNVSFLMPHVQVQQTVCAALLSNTTSSVEGVIYVASCGKDNCGKVEKGSFV